MLATSHRALPASQGARQEENQKLLDLEGTKTAYLI
jgi:hypothetical protein